MKENGEDNNSGNRHLIRIGGLAILVGLGLHIYLNGFLKEFPPEHPTLAELQDYFAAEAGTWAIVHGLKYLALVSLVIFAAAVFTRTCLTRGVSGIGWGVIGLLGSAIHVTNALITNGIEAFAFYDFAKLSEEANLFWLLFYLVRVLFTAEIVAWGLTIFGFSMAGRQSSTLPWWITWLGFICAGACMFSGVFFVSVLKGGWASVFMEIATLMGLAWFAAVGFLMLLRGDS
jgi:hypothetical protein